MKLVIDIDDNTYNDIEKSKVYTSVRDVPQESVLAIRHGTPLDTVLDEIRAEINEQYDRVHPYNISCAEGLEMALEIINKHRAESEDKE